MCFTVSIHWSSTLPHIINQKWKCPFWPTCLFEFVWMKSVMPWNTYECGYSDEAKNHFPDSHACFQLSSSPHPVWLHTSQRRKRRMGRRMTSRHTWSFYAILFPKLPDLRYDIPYSLPFLNFSSEVWINLYLLENYSHQHEQFTG